MVRVGAAAVGAALSLVGRFRTVAAYDGSPYCRGGKEAGVQRQSKWCYGDWKPAMRTPPCLTLRSSLLRPAEPRILLSHNRRHFLRLHQHRTEDHAGIVLCTFDPDSSGLARRIHIAVASVSDMANQAIRVNRPG